jgi:ketose-bisphosphate aldolase
MSSVYVKNLLKDAIERNYCVGYFESWDLESTLAIVRAAEKLKSPVMIGFCGGYLLNSERTYREDLFLYGMMLRRIANTAAIPVSTLLNECTDFYCALRGIAAGFDMVMLVNDEMTIPAYTAAQQKLVEFAHSCHAAVEAEIGALPTANQSSGAKLGGYNTDINLASQFVKDSGVDALSVAVGNVHLLEGAKAQLDLELLASIREKVDVPLVLHGGTGIDKAIFKEAIKCGVAKVNIGTGHKRAAINAYKDYFGQQARTEVSPLQDIDKLNPNIILGNGSKTDIQQHIHDAIFEIVVTFIQAFGSENKA